MRTIVVSSQPESSQGLRQVQKPVLEPSSYAGIGEQEQEEEVSEWISVKDKRMPKRKDDLNSERILLYVSSWARNPDIHNPIAMGVYLYGSKQFRPDGSFGFERDVTHWMPLPDPPK